MERGICSSHKCKIQTPNREKCSFLMNRLYLNLCVWNKFVLCPNVTLALDDTVSLTAHSLSERNHVHTLPCHGLLAPTRQPCYLKFVTVVKGLIFDPFSSHKRSDVIHFDDIDTLLYCQRNINII